MVKKIALLLIMVFSFLFTQNTVFSQDKYSEEFYLDNLQKKIELNWIEPIGSKGKSAVVSFTVSRDGQISNVKVLRSSQDKAFDKSAVNAVYKCLTFAPLFNNKNSLNVQFFFNVDFTVAAIVNNENNIFNDENIVNVANKSFYPEVNDYANNLQNKINSNWNPKTLKKQRNAVVSINMSKDGALNNIRILKSSGNKKFDKSTIDAILTSVPLGALPEAFIPDCTKINLNFDYIHANKQSCHHNVSADLKNTAGYDKYVKQVGDVILNNLDSKRYFFNKSLIVKVSIDKTGKLKYVKLQSPAKYDNFSRQILSIIQTSSFPPIPEETGLENITLSYRILTKNPASLNDFFFDYLIYFGTKELKILYI